MKVQLLSTSMLPLIHLATIVSDYLDARSARIEQRRTLNALSSLDNRALKDMAISRSEIVSIAYAGPGERRRRG